LCEAELVSSLGDDRKRQADRDPPSGASGQRLLSGSLVCIDVIVQYTRDDKSNREQVERFMAQFCVVSGEHSSNPHGKDLVSVEVGSFQPSSFLGKLVGNDVLALHLVNVSTRGHIVEPGVFVD